MKTLQGSDLKKEIVAICKLMDMKGLTAGTEGNVSARDTDGSVLMTPSGYNKGDISEDMLVRLDLAGNVIDGDFAPTSEKYMHLEFYNQRPGAHGVAHGHPIFSTAFAASGRDLPHNILPELVAVIGPVVTVPYGRPSSAELAKALAPYVKRHNVFLLQNHGSTAVGSSVRDAFHRLVVVEAYAKTVWAATALGGVHPMTREQIANLPMPSFD